MKKLQNKLEKLLQKRDKMNMEHMERYRNGSATRARTTTYNARSADLNEQIQEVRDEIKIYGV
jgi:chromosome segregation ATPase